MTKREIARSRAAATNRAADANKAEANKEAVSKADDKLLCREINERREATPAVFSCPFTPAEVRRFPSAVSIPAKLARRPSYFLVLPFFGFRTTAMSRPEIRKPRVKCQMSDLRGSSDRAS